MLIKTLLIFAVLAAAFLAYRNVSQAENAPKVGALAPQFNLPDANGNMLSLADLQGKWVVLYFYPRDDTPGCTKEACSFRDDMHKLEKLNAKIVGVSIDDGKSHAEFAKKYSLPFALLSDKNGLVASQYGALVDLIVYKMARRYTFLINPQGVLQKSYLDVNVSKHSQQIIDDLVQLNATKVD